MFLYPREEAWRQLNSARRGRGRLRYFCLGKGKETHSSDTLHNLLGHPLPLQYHDICRVHVAVVDTTILGVGRAVDALLASRLYAECCGFVVC